MQLSETGRLESANQQINVGRSRRRCTAGFVCLTVAALVAVAVSGVARARESEGFLTFGIEPALNTRYLWRGMAQNAGPVFQPSGWASAAGFTFTPWANFVLGDEENRWRFNEVDLYLDYEAEWRGLEFAPSLGVYVYPNQPDVPTTADLTLELGLPFGPVRAFTGHTVDVVASPGAYFGELGLACGYEPVEALLLEAQAKAGWASVRFNEAFVGVDKAALNVASLGISFTWSLPEAFYVRPCAECCLFVDRDVREAQSGPVTFAAGLALGREF